MRSQDNKQVLESVLKVLEASQATKHTVVYDGQIMPYYEFQEKIDNLKVQINKLINA